jgi:hypothetical protein
VGKNEKEEIKKLEAKVRELELTVSTQTKLIEIFKSIPGYERAITDDATKKGISKYNKKRDRAMAHNSAKGKSENNGTVVGDKHAHSKRVEEKSPSAN